MVTFQFQLKFMKKKSTNITEELNKKAEELVKLLKDYEKCDHDFIDLIVDISGYPLETIFQILTNNPENEDLTYIEAAISSARAQTTVVAVQDTTISDLRTLSKSIIDPSEFRLSSLIYNKLGKLLASYSSHRGTHTVYFRNNKVDIRPSDAYQDGSKDTFEDNGRVADNYLKLLNAIVDFARETNKEDFTFKILAKLYSSLTTLSDDACNQQNAIDFASILIQYAPLAEESEAASSEVNDTEHQQLNASEDSSFKDNSKTNSEGNVSKRCGDKNEKTCASTDNQKQEKNTDSKIKENSIEANNDANSILESFFIDIEFMPKWLQSLILSSHPAQMILKSIAARNEIYHPKSLTAKFEEIIQTQDPPLESEYYATHDQVTYLNEPTNLVDTSYIYTAKVGILILPMLGISIMPNEPTLFEHFGIDRPVHEQL